MATTFDALPREYVLDFSCAGGNVAAYDITVAVATEKGLMADYDFPVPVGVSGGLLRDAIYAAFKDNKGIEAKCVGEHLLRIRGPRNERLLFVRVGGAALQQVNGPRGVIILQLSPGGR